MFRAKVVPFNGAGGVLRAQPSTGWMRRRKEQGPTPGGRGSTGDAALGEAGHDVALEMANTTRMGRITSTAPAIRMPQPEPLPSEFCSRVRPTGRVMVSGRSVMISGQM